MEEIKLAKLKNLYFAKNSNDKYVIVLWAKASGFDSSNYALRELLVLEKPDGPALIKCNKPMHGSVKSVANIVLSDYSNFEQSQLLDCINIHAGTLIRWIDYINGDYAQDQLQYILNSASLQEKLDATKNIKKALLSCMLVDYSVFAEEYVKASQDGSEMSDN